MIDRYAWMDSFTDSRILVPCAPRHDTTAVRCASLVVACSSNMGAISSADVTLETTTSRNASPYPLPLPLPDPRVNSDDSEPDRRTIAVTR